MTKISTIKLDKELYELLDSVPMAPYDRSMAIGAMRNAEAIIDAIAWVARKFEGIAQRFSAPRAGATGLRA